MGRCLEPARHKRPEATQWSMKAQMSTHFLFAVASLQPLNEKYGKRSLPLFIQFFLFIDLECLMKTQVREIRKYLTPLCCSILRTPENNVVKCIKGKNAKKEKAGAPAKTNSIILNRRDGVPRIFAKPRSASFHTTRFDLKFTLAFKICPLAKLGNSLSREDPNFIDLLIFLKII